MALRFKLQLGVVADDDQPVSVDDLVVLNKDHERLEHLGLTLAEAKALLLELQHQILSPPGRRVPGLARALPSLRPKPWPQRSQDHRLPHLVRLAGAGQPAAASVPMPALWLGIQQPARRVAARAYGTRAAVPGEQVVVPGLVWADLVKVLRDFLPVDTRLKAMSVRRDTMRVARRLEAELGPEPIFPLAGCPGECARLPAPPAPIIVGLDGGYLRS